MQTPIENSPKIVVSIEQGIQAACFLFELNTKEQDVLDMAQQAGIPCGPADPVQDLLREWYGFVHAAVVYALLDLAPHAVMTGYLSSTRALLGNVAGYEQDTMDRFIDETFAGYMTLMAEKQQKQCPALLYSKVLGSEDITTLPPERVAFLSGMMAITMCAILDKCEQLTFEEE